MTDIELLAKRARIATILTAHANGDGHLSSSCSHIEILTAILSVHLESHYTFPRLILSKGHGALGFYSVLCMFDYLKPEELLTYGKNRSRLMSHPQRGVLSEIELSTGSLGMGLGFACGLALANKLNQKNELIYVVMGDGETNEGSVWEAAMFASAQNLNQLRVFIDHNKIQAVSNYSDVAGGGSLCEKFLAFGWDAVEVNGHDLAQLVPVATKSSSRPLAIIAHTTGKTSFPYEEDSVLWHYRRPDDEDMTLFEKKLNMQETAPDLMALFT